MIEVNLQPSLVNLETPGFYDGWRKDSQCQLLFQLLAQTNLAIQHKGWNAGLTMSVAKNLGPRNILVNTVFPGPMITGMTQNGLKIRGFNRYRKFPSTPDNSRRSR